MNEAEITKDKLVSDFKSVLHDVEVLLKESAGQLGEKASVLRERLDDGVRRVRGQLEGLENTVFSKGKEAARATDDFVHDHPWQSAGVAFGIGLLLGVLLNRR